MDTLITDKVVRFLAVRTYPSGKRTYVYLERRQRRRRVVAIAPVGAIPLVSARDVARRYFLSSLTEVPRETNRLFADLAEEFMSRHSSVHKKSCKMDQSRLDRYILPALRHLRLDEIDRLKIETLHAHIAQSHAVTANRCLTLLITIFNKAVEWGYIKENPAAGVKLLKEKSRERFASDKEVERLLSAIGRLRDKRMRVLFQLYLLTAARKNELLGLKWADVGDRQVVFRDTKGGKNHCLPLSDRANTLLQSLPREGVLVFPGRNGGKRHDVKRHWNKIRKEAGVEDLHLHDLRRTAGSYLAKKGVSEVVIGKILNHSSPKTTRIYTRFNDKESAAAVSVLDELILGHH